MASTRCLALLALVLPQVLSPSRVDAQLTAGPGYELTFQLFDAEPLVPFVFAPEGAPSFDSYMYGIRPATGGFEFDAVDESGVHTLISPLPHDSAALVFGINQTADRLFLNDVGSPFSFPDGIYDVSPTGELALLSDLGGGNPDPQVATPPASWGDVIAIANPLFGASSAYNNRIVLTDLNGVLVQSLVLGGRPQFMAAPLEAGTPYGDFLYYTDLDRTAVYRVDASGAVEVFSSEDGLATLRFSRGGSFGSSLYAFRNDGAANSIYRIDPDGSTELVVTGILSAAYDFEPGTGDLFVIGEQPSYGLYRASPSTYFQRADRNQDGNLDISDPIGFLDELFSGGAVSDCEKACDANDDGAKDIGDVVFTLSFLFDGGESPPAPFGACGSDSTADSLTCDSFATCP